MMIVYQYTISLKWRNIKEWTQIGLTHLEQSNLDLHCFEYAILVCVCITLREFRQIE